MKTLLVSLCLAVTALACRALAGPDVIGGSPAVATDVVQRFLQTAEPRLVSYRARRTLEASALGGRVSASLVADTRLDPDGTFSFEVGREEGSGIIRERVLKAALFAEQQSRANGELDAAALTPANYDFRLRSDGRSQALQLQLLPKRRSRMLLDGFLVLASPAGDLLRLEGKPTELPSYWTREVTIVQEYARINDVRVPTRMVSRADVRVVGAASFSMTYAYTAINGKAVTPPASR